MRWTHTDAMIMVQRHGGKVWEIPNIAGTEIRKGKDGDFHLFYRGTCLVTYHPDNTFTLNTNGWKTKTTKKRLSDFGPCDVFQKDNVWYLYREEGPLEFEEGMRVGQFGEVIDPEPPDIHAVEMTVDNQIGKEFF